MGKVSLVYSFSEAYEYDPYHHVFQEEAFRDLKWESGTHQVDVIGVARSWNPRFLAKRMQWSNKTNTNKLLGWVIGCDHHNLSVTAKTGRLLGLTEDVRPVGFDLGALLEAAQGMVAENLTRQTLRSYPATAVEVAHAEGVSEAQLKMREALGVK